MAGPTTYRSEIDIAPVALNRGAFLSFPSSLAGTSPYNPAQVGMGLTFTIQGGASVAAVTARMVYLLDDTRQTAGVVSLTKLATQEQTWQAKGVVGGESLGFPTCFDYDVPKPFELELTILYRGGTETRTYTIWVANSEHAGCSPCFVRTPFQMRLRNCCFNGQPFRTDISLFGIYGPYDVYFDPNGYGWALGSSALFGGAIEMACAGAELRNPYIPDAISGVVSDPPQPIDPFVPRQAAVVTVDKPYDLLGAAERLRPFVENSAAGLGIQVSKSASPPDDLYGNAYLSIAGGGTGTRTLPVALYSAADPLDTREATPRRRGRLQAFWQAATNPVGEPHLDIQSDGLDVVQNPPSIQITLSGLDPGETAYLFAAVAHPNFSGEIDPGTTNPENVDPGIISDPLELERRIPPLTPNGAAGAVVSPLVTGLGGVNSPLNPLYTPRAITGTPTWNQTTQGLGGIARVGAATSVTFLLIADMAYARVATTKISPGAGGPENEHILGTLILQAVICRPSTSPYFSSGAAFGVAFPQSAFLTNKAVLTFRD